MSPTTTPSKLATTAALIAAAAVSLPALGVIGIHLGVLAPMGGFYLFAAGCVLGSLLSLVLGGAAVFVTRGGKDPEGRKRAWIAIGAGLALFGVVALSAGPSRDLPPINDITTNLSDPPAFTSDPAGRGRDMSYPAEFVSQVEAAYPDLRTLQFSGSPQEAFAKSIASAESLGWQITTRDDAAGTFEATQSTAVFQFVDDVVVRIRPDGSGAAIDLRSKSRDGRGDLGANAARIRAFTQAFATR